MHSMQCMLGKPDLHEPFDPAQNVVAMEQFLSDSDVFETAAREWTERYATFSQLDPILRDSLQLSGLTELQAIELLRKSLIADLPK